VPSRSPGKRETEKEVTQEKPKKETAVRRAEGEEGHFFHQWAAKKNCLREEKGGMLILKKH